MPPLPEARSDVASSWSVGRWSPSASGTGFPSSSTNCQDGPAKGKAGAGFEADEDVESDEDAQPPTSKATAPSARTGRVIFITRCELSIRDRRKPRYFCGSGREAKAEF